MHLPQEMEANSDITSLLPSDDSVQRTRAFYDTELKPILEPDNNGKYVAIHSDTHDYLVERAPGKALRAMQAKHAEGSIIVRHIGTADSGLKARLRGERPR